jgi:hypothetical protein
MGSRERLSRTAELGGRLDASTTSSTTCSRICRSEYVNHRPRYVTYMRKPGEPLSITVCHHKSCTLCAVCTRPVVLVQELCRSSAQVA